MVAVAKVNGSQTRRLSRLLKGNKKRLRREVSIAINATAKKSQTIISKGVREELAVTAKGVKQTISIVTKARPKLQMRATVRLHKTRRPSLKEFKPRQTRNGVSYRISKGGGRQVAPTAFMGPRPGVMSVKLRGHAFKRVGTERLPITKLHGPSPWAVFHKQRLRTPTNKEVKAELKKQIRRRIRFLRLKMKNKI